MFAMTLISWLEDFRNISSYVLIVLLPVLKTHLKIEYVCKLEFLEILLQIFLNSYLYAYFILGSMSFSGFSYSFIDITFRSLLYERIKIPVTFWLFVDNS